MPSPSVGADELYMERALHLARQGIGLASPNPQVGCVLVRAGEVVGEGTHLYSGRDHAEVVALKHAGNRARGSTAYVTLEPCSHHGRTGPCADALLAAGVTRVVVATLDPNPLVRGQGAERLRRAGVDLEVGVLQEPARDLNDAFAFSIQNHRPLVTLKAAVSADGKLAPPPSDRLHSGPHWLTGAAARAEVHLLRHAADAILTGIGTVLADDPALTDRSERPRRRPLLRVVLDTRLRIPLSSTLVQSADEDLLVICGSSAPASRIDALEACGVRVETVPEHGGRLSLPSVLDALGAEEIRGLLLETGSHLNGSFLAQRLVEKAAIFYAPEIIGEHGIPFAHGFPGPEALVCEMDRMERRVIGSDLLVTGYLRDPWATPSTMPARL